MQSSASKIFAYHGDASSLVKLREYDVLYLDPPYNERSYAHYYHLPEAIALQKTPKTHGKSGITNNIKTISRFNRQNSVRQALVDLLEHARFRLLFFIMRITDSCQQKNLGAFSNRMENARNVNF